MSVLNADSARLLSTAFPSGGAYLVTGRYDAADKLKPVSEGHAGTITLPDDADCYYCVASIPAGGDRTGPDKVMVLVVDDVGKEIDQFMFDATFPLKPSFVVESSAGSYQYGFIVSGGMEPENYRALRRAMKVSGIWGKAHNTGAAAIFRLPQGVHTKSTRGGWKCRLEEWSGLSYAEAEIWGALGLPAPAVVGVGVGAPDPVADRELLRELAGLIPNPVADWDFFVDVGRAIWGASGGEAADVYHEWAAKFPGNDPAVTQGRWDSFRDARIGRHWLLREASAANASGAEAWRRKEARTVFPPGAAGEADGPVDVLALQRDVANFIARGWRDRLRYNVSTGMWHQFLGDVWRESAFDIGFRLAKRWADDNAGALGTAARKVVSAAGFYEGVAKILRVELACVKTDFDRDDWLLGTPGGTVELRTGVLRASVASEMISLSCAVAPSEGEDCPRWKKFVDWACTDPATGKVDIGMRRMLRQWAGYCLTGDVSKEMVMFFHGAGANGKGTFIETLQAAMGDYFYMATKDLFMASKFGTHTEEIAGLAGKRMVAADEVPTNAQWNESLLKAMSGGRTMRSRHLYGKTFEFPIRFKITISGNAKPTFQGEINEALKRRLHLVAFRMTAAPRSDTLKEELRAEAAGVLRWALGGLLDMLTSPGGGLFIADSSEDATRDYFNENDLFGQWLDEKTEVTPGKNGKSGELFDDWISWRNGVGNHELFNHARAFKVEMGKRGFVWHEVKTGKVFKNISLKVFDRVADGGGW